MSIKPLGEATSLPTGTASAITLGGATLMHIFVGGTIVTGGSTADTDGVLVAIVDAPNGNVVSSLRLAPGSMAQVEKQADHYVYATGATGNVYGTKIAFTN